MSVRPTDRRGCERGRRVGLAGGVCRPSARAHGAWSRRRSVVFRRCVRCGAPCARARRSVSEPDQSKRVYDGKLFDVVVEKWDGREREIVEHPGSAAIVAIDSEGYVTLVRQLREPARKHLLELPAGTLEEDEEALVTAQRELAEEVGRTGGRWREL